MEKSYVGFKLRANVTMYVAGKLFLPPAELKWVPIDEISDPFRKLLVPVYDMEKVHRLEIKSAIPTIPPNPGYSDEHYSKLVDRIIDRALDVRDELAGLKAELEDLAKRGLIQITEDPTSLMTSSDLPPLSEEQREARQQAALDKIAPVRASR